MYESVKVNGKSLCEIQVRLNYEFSLGELYRMLVLDKVPLSSVLSSEI